MSPNMMEASQPSDPTDKVDDEAQKASTVDEATTTTATVSEEEKKLATFGQLAALVHPEACALLFACLLMIVAEATGIINPIIVASAYDDLVDTSLTSSQRIARINGTMTVVLIVHCIGVTLAFVRSSIMWIVGEKVVTRVRRNLYRSLLAQEISFFDGTASGELTSRLGSDVQLLQQGTSQAFPEVALGVCKVVVSVIIMFWISAKLAGLLLSFVVVILLICIPFGQWMGNLSKQYQDILGRAQTAATEALGAMRTVQSCTAESREDKRYGMSIGDPQDVGCGGYPRQHKEHPTTYSVGYFKAIATVALFTTIFGAGFGSMYVCLWYGFKLVTDGEITLGQLTAFQSYIFTIGGAMGQTSQFVSKLIEARGAAARVIYLLERVPSIPTPPDKADAGKGEAISNDAERPSPLQKPSSMAGAVDFNNVTFSYPSRPNVTVLDNFSLSIPANQTAALVGASGAGKSTVVALVQRFYDVTGGSVTVDGVDVRDLDLNYLRTRIAYVQQEPQLFGLTVRENITYGLERDVPMSKIEEVARKANAHDFVQKWPDKYETLVGERGIQLSGGQKQRLAIARALLINPKILLLDEATSALDSESEHLVQEAIDQAVVGRTVIIVAHRLSTIMRAEQIVVVDEHKIADVGTHEQLLGRCSKYQDLIKRQSLMSSMPDDVADAIKKKV